MVVPDLNKNEFAQLNGNGNNGALWYLFNGPQYKFTNPANAMVSGGKLLVFPAPSPNSSHSVYGSGVTV